MGSQKSRVVILSAVVTALVAVVVVLCLYVSGSPGVARAIRLDERRVQNLYSIHTAVEQYYNARENLKLPGDLYYDLAAMEIYGVLSLYDPVTGRAYSYHVKTADTYTLCAVFETDNVSTQYMAKRAPTISREASTENVDFSYHPRGEHCFDVRVRKWLNP
jgi:hypothetical protein